MLHLLRTFCLVTLLSGIVISSVWSQGPAVRIPDARSAMPIKHSNPKEKQKLREGSRLEDVVGRFDFAGERMAFYPTGESESYRVLENLSLERIWQTAQDSNRKQEWVVSGTITEFRGANYLLVTRAMIRVEETKVSLSK